MDLQSDLMRIGFTEYEAKVYLALLVDNPTTGYQISKSSGVPRSMVYETLSRLHSRGAVMETVEGRSTLYRPLPPDVLIDQFAADHLRLVESLREGMLRLYTASKEERSWSISGRSTILSYANQMLDGAESEVFLVLNDADLDALHEGIVMACQREVTVSTLLTGEKPLECGSVIRHPPLESELQGLTGTLLIVVDNAEALVASSNDEMTATITGNANLVLIARQFVWMELFTQRVYAKLGADLLERLEPEDRQIFESLTG
jgi:sugar-specific transcriptional regulator TrmB